MKHHSKRSLRALIVAAAAVCLLCGMASAAETGIITAKVVNARSGPGTEYDRVELLASGKQVTILGEENGWYQVSWDRSKGYIRQDLVAVSVAGEGGAPAAEAAPAPAPAPAAPAEDDTDAVVTGGKVINVRSGPGTDYSRITQVKAGRRVKVLGKEGDWYHISVGSKEGFILTDYLLPDGSSEPVKAAAPAEPAPAPEPVADTSNAAVSGGKTINVRIGPGTNYSRVTKVSGGKRVEITGQQDGWYQVSFDGMTGFISGEYVTPDDPAMAIVREEPSAEPAPAPAEAPAETPAENPAGLTEAQVGELEETITANDSQTLGAPGGAVTTKQSPGDGVIVGGTINVRTGPGTEYERVAKFTTGKRVTILGQEDGWYHIGYETGEGYVRGDYIMQGDLLSGDSLGGQVVNLAMQFQGVRYIYGGTTPNGFDCSGFTSYIYRQFGYSLPHTASGQYANCGYKVSRSELQPGDLVFFTSSGNGGRINHVGIYIGSGQVIHARYSIGKVYINSLFESYYNSNYVGAVRIG